MTFQALFEHSSIGIIISNREGTIEKTNPYAAKMFGHGPHELVGQKIEVLIPKPLRDRHVTYRNQYNENPQPRTMGSTLNLMAVKKNGELFPVEVSLSYFEAQGKRQIVSFVNDITERKRAEDRLKQLTEALESKVEERTRELSDALMELNLTNRGLEQEMERRKEVEARILSNLGKEKELNELKSRFVSMASHEFRTPLSGILTSATLIARYNEAQDTPKREKHIQTIKNSVRNLTSILNDFLSLDKLEQGKAQINLSSFSLALLVEEIVGEMQESALQGQKIRVKVEDHGNKIHQDKEMLRNVLINLISNASKYSPAESTIHIEGRLEKGQVILTIQDEGIGIPVEDQKHLFERFFRAHNATMVQGTGLGLNIVKRYLDLMGGQISFESRENEGTTFTVILPLERKE